MPLTQTKEPEASQGTASKPVNNLKEAKKVVEQVLEEPQKKIKHMDIGEFRRLGLLQEINRQFLHPLGLALELEAKWPATVTKEDKKRYMDPWMHPRAQWSMSGIWDYRDDPEGIVYDLRNSKQERVEEFLSKFNSFCRLAEKQHASRLKTLGFTIERIPNKKKLEKKNVPA